MVIRILESLSNSEKLTVFNQPVKFNDFVSRDHFDEARGEVVGVLNKAMKNVHRLPVVIQPVIESLKDEITKRADLI